MRSLRVVLVCASAGATVWLLAGSQQVWASVPAPILPPPPAPLPPPSSMLRTEPPRPASNPETWVTVSDYPVSSMHDNETGTVRFVVMYDRTGTPTKCEITASSGHPMLDNTTCNLMIVRARFIPGKRDGEPQPGRYASTVNWILPEEKLAALPTQERAEMNYIIAIDGSVANCQWKGLDGRVRTIPSENEVVPCPAGKTFAVPIGPSGKPVARRVTLTYTTKVEDVP